MERRRLPRGGTVGQAPVLLVGVRRLAGVGQFLPLASVSLRAFHQTFVSCREATQTTRRTSSAARRPGCRQGDRSGADPIWAGRERESSHPRVACASAQVGTGTIPSSAESFLCGLNRNRLGTTPSRWPSTVVPPLGRDRPQPWQHRHPGHRVSAGGRGVSRVGRLRVTLLAHADAWKG